jgi:2-alkenal reductase
MNQHLLQRPRAAILTAAAALALITGAGASVTGNVLAQEAATTNAQCNDVAAVEMSVADVAEKVNPAVVTITNLQSGQSWDSGNGGDLPAIPGMPEIPGLPSDPSAGEGDMPSGATPMGVGSGFIIDEAGHVVTNAHVVDGSDKLTAMFEDGSTVNATLVGQDDLLDIAVVQLDLNGKQVPGIACFGDSGAARPGEQVVAIGSALGEFTNTVTEGTINAKGRDLDGYGLNSLIQHDANIWHGNSGGPLLNLKGEVIGVNAAGISSDQMGTAPADMAFAIDGNAALDVVDQLLVDGSVDRPFLGIQGEALPIGHMVEDVVAGSGADDAGIIPGDVIVAIDGTNVTRKNTLLDQLMQRESGDTIQVTIDREGDQQVIPVSLGERPADAS